jgi:hypothetical protein
MVFIDGAFIIVLYMLAWRCRSLEGALDKLCTVVVWGAFLSKETGDAYAGGQHVSLVLGARSMMTRRAAGTARG